MDEASLYKENRESRQCGTYGSETMKKISHLKVLIIGMRGLGVETAKNAILTGPQRVDIYDDTKTEINDLGANFYLTENDVGKPRDECCVDKLRELNPSVQVNVIRPKDNDIINDIKNYHVVIVTELKPPLYIKKLNEECRNNNSVFLYSSVLGLVGFIFTDFGPNHVINDRNGVPPKKFYVKKITKEENALLEVTPVSGKGDMGSEGIISFKEVEGMDELNGTIRQYELEKYCIFRIGDTREYKDYIKGGIVTEIKKNIYKTYKPYYEMLLIPNIEFNFPIYDSNKKGRNQFLLIVLTVLSNYIQANNGILPEYDDKTALDYIKKYTKLYYDNIKNIPYYKDIEQYNEQIIEYTVKWCRSEISPMCGFFGGVLSHEIVKVTGKYMPIEQWYIQDFFETVQCIPKDILSSTSEPKKTRYTDQSKIYGIKTTQQLNNTNTFIIGAGATGSEFLKNLCMMGIGVNNNIGVNSNDSNDSNDSNINNNNCGIVSITDNDNIEISNLSRQFLYRKCDIGKSKAEIASKRIYDMNNDFNSCYYNIKCCYDTEDIFNEKFWDKQDLIIMAVDSVSARKYIDGKVIDFKKRGLDAGTLGVLAKTQIIVPNMSSTYSDYANETQEQHIPMCTLRHFPSSINHCIEWSLDKFSEYFTDIIKDISLYYEDFEVFKTSMRNDRGSAPEKLDRIKCISVLLDICSNKNYDRLVALAIDKYNENYDFNIQQLLYNCPEGFIDEKGELFWGAQRRLPHPIPFNISNSKAIDYIKWYIYIMNNALGLDLDDIYFSNKKIIESAKKYKIPEFKVSKVEIDPSISNNNNDNDNNDNNNNNNNNINTDIEDITLLEKQEHEFNTLLEQTIIYTNIKPNITNIENNITNTNLQNPTNPKPDQLKKPTNTTNTHKTHIQIKPQEFEKDHDENGHLDFIYVSACIRAENYKIDVVDRNETKMIAGKIIPAIITSTAAVCGLACMEIYPLLYTNDLSYLRNGYINLGLSDVILTNPTEAFKYTDVKYDENLFTAVKIVPEGITCWDIVDISAPMTVKELMDLIAEKYKIELETIVVEDEMIYDNYVHRNKKDRTNKMIEDLYYEILENKKKKKIEGKVYLFITILGRIKNVIIDDEKIESASAKLPKFRYKLKK